ncbi:MAG: hypothetical protein LBB92_03205 [Endomicrobium sp.]|nr:hypothetical protein [Endomicrobium sp.]
MKENFKKLYIRLFCGVGNADLIFSDKCGFLKVRLIFLRTQPAGKEIAKYFPLFKW